MNDIVQAEEIQVLDTASLATVTRSEIETQLAAAEKRPRVISKFFEDVKTIACSNPKVAESTFYRLRRSGKTIEGPSVRLAEIVASRYRNLRVGGRVVEINDSHVVAEGVCHDLETNTSVQTETRRRIKDRNGRRYNEDMIATTAQAAVSIAVRNAVFRVVPRALIDPLLDDCKKAALGKGTVEEQRAKAMAHFEKLGRGEADVLRYLGRRRIEDVDVEDILTLRGVAQAVKDGETSLEAEFAPRSDDVAPESDALASAVAEADAEAGEPEAG